MKNIKWNWGTKLALFIIAFILFILILVYQTTKYDVNLVEKDYYPKGLVYQQRIDAIDNAKSIGADFMVTQNNNNLMFAISNIVADSGSVLFFRPSNTNLDMLYDLTSIDSVMILPVSNFENGKYKVKTNWWKDGIEYYIEKTYVVK